MSKKGSEILDLDVGNIDHAGSEHIHWEREFDDDYDDTEEDVTLKDVMDMIAAAYNLGKYNGKLNIDYTRLDKENLKYAFGLN